MRIHTPVVRIIVRVSVRGWPRRAQRRPISVRSLMKAVVVAALLLAWIDWGERSNARWYLSLPRPRGVPISAHELYLIKPWTFETIGRLPWHLLTFFGAVLALVVCFWVVKCALEGDPSRKWRWVRPQPC